MGHVYRRCYSPDAIKKFNDILMEVDWQDIVAYGKDKDVNRTYDMFHNKYLEIYNICFPIQMKILSGKNARNNLGLPQHLLNLVTKNQNYI